VDEQLRHERLADRYRKLIDECHHAEHLRHTPRVSSSPSSRDESSAETPRDW
jgi:hypothetical protein